MLTLVCCREGTGEEGAEGRVGYGDAYLSAGVEVRVFYWSLYHLNDFITAGK